MASCKRQQRLQSKERKRQSYPSDTKRGTRIELREDTKMKIQEIQNIQKLSEDEIKGRLQKMGVKTQIRKKEKLVSLLVEQNNKT